MAAFEYRQAVEIRDAFRRHGVEYLFIGKAGAILLGFPDTTQDADLFVKKSASNCELLLRALADLGFQFSEQQTQEILRGKVLIRLKNGAFDVNLTFAPDGIETFEDAWKRHVDVEGFPVCHIDDIIQSKQAANRRKDRESLPRLLSFRKWLAKGG